MSTVLDAPGSTEVVEPEGRYEVIGGQVVEKAPMGAYETSIACLLFELLAPFTRSRRLGQCVTEMLF